MEDGLISGIMLRGHWGFNTFWYAGDLDCNIIFYKSLNIQYKMKKALITGITGQDGSYLAEFLLEKGYEVHGLVKRSSNPNTYRIDHLLNANKVLLHYGDLIDANSIVKILSETRPDEVYNLAAQTDVRISFDTPQNTGYVTGIGCVNLLESIKNIDSNIRFYQASSSEMFGKVREIPQKETTPFYPRSPYGCAKVYAFWMTVNYRDSYNLFMCNGILFNHESPRRGENFVTKKIAKGLAEIKKGNDKPLSLGNLEAKRDWGYAKDYVEGMWLMLQQEKPDDYILATGETHTVREFVEETCKILDIKLRWRGKGLDEKGIDSTTNKVILEVDKKYFRPAEVDILIGDYSKAKNTLGWSPKTNYKQLIELMVKKELGI